MERLSLDTAEIKSKCRPEKSSKLKGERKKNTINAVIHDNDLRNGTHGKRKKKRDTAVSLIQQPLNTSR